MFLEFISITSYKNLREVSLELSPTLNYFVGSNGAGKTNVLDAIHYLSLTKSAVKTTDTRCVMHGESFFMLRGEYSLDERKEVITVSYSTQHKKKTVMRGGKEYERFSEHIGRFGVVMISPADSSLISDEPENRRRFIDTFFSQIDSEYLNILVRYNSVLQQRNTILKSECVDDELLEIYTLQLSELAQSVAYKRSALIEQLAPLVAHYYSVISGDKEVIEVKYKSQLNNYNIYELLTHNLQRDKILGYTTAGVHRDDLTLTMNCEAIRAYGSQGQQKSLLLALKLAEAKIMGEKTLRRPILLLDDIFDKLDMARVENLIRLVSGEDFGQIFLSDASKVRLESIAQRFNADYKLFEVSEGQIQQQ
ncbi:MAG: DNA replication and repair protein RecF [Rikenellaceae bacterium]